MLIPIRGVENVEALTTTLGCKMGHLPTSYLGLPLGGFGKRQYLIKGGRFTLIKSTLSSLQIYFMSLFVIPKKASLRLE